MLRRQKSQSEPPLRSLPNSARVPRRQAPEPGPTRRCRRGFAHLGGQEPREMARLPPLPLKSPSSRTRLPHAAAAAASSSSFLFGDGSGLCPPAKEVRQRGGSKLAARSQPRRRRCWRRGRPRAQRRPARRVPPPAHARPRPSLTSRRHRPGRRPRSERAVAADGDLRPDAQAPPGRCSGRSSGRLARTKRSRGAGGGQARASERAAQPAQPARLAREVRAAVTAAGRRAGPRGRAARGGEARTPSRPPRDAHAGARAPRPAAPPGSRCALCRPRGRPARAVPLRLRAAPTAPPRPGACRRPQRGGRGCRAGGFEEQDLRSSSEGEEGTASNAGAAARVWAQHGEPRGQWDSRGTRSPK